jgi:hypothetical protein
MLGSVKTKEMCWSWSRVVLLAVVKLALPAVSLPILLAVHRLDVLALPARMLPMLHAVCTLVKLVALLAGRRLAE